MVVVGVSFLLLLFGVLYAVRIALRPFAIGRTWISVVIGDAATAAGMSALLAYFGYRFGLLPWQVAILAAIPWWCLALTGLTMIGAQVEKHALRANDIQALKAEEDESDADSA
jgi:hypothetical protein